MDVLVHWVVLSPILSMHDIIKLAGNVIDVVLN